jgi:hypothetical protein
MGLLRGRREAGGMKYRMREKMFAIGDDFWIEDEDGVRAFKTATTRVAVNANGVLDKRRLTASGHSLEAPARGTIRPCCRALHP